MVVGEVLSAEVKNLDVNDVISFANAITGLSIPQPPNFVQFQDVELYICPFGTTIGTIVYPKGFSFQASMTVFGKHASVACAVGSSNVTIKGSLDDFSLGPLSVRGLHDAHPTLDVEIGLGNQHIDIDGMVTFFDAEVAISTNIEVLPSPAFAFTAVSSLLTHELTGGTH